MSNPSRLRRPATVLAMAVVVSMGASVPAMGASPKRPPVAVKKATKAPKAAHVTLKGVVVGRGAKSLSVLTSSVKVSGAGRVPTAKVVTVNTARLRTVAATLGQTVEASGAGALTGSTVTLTNPTSIRLKAAPTRAWTGRILAVDTTTGTLTVTRREHLDGSGEGRDNDHPRRGYGHADGAMVLHTAQASVSLDGVPAQASSLAAGQQVIVMGSNDGDVATASNVFAFTATPAVTRGRVASVSGSVVTLRSGAKVDLTGVAVALNGAVADAAALTAGTNLWVVTPAGAATASVALGFDRRDAHPAWHYGNRGFHQYRDDSGVNPSHDAPGDDDSSSSEPTPVPTQTPTDPGTTPDAPSTESPDPEPSDPGASQSADPTPSDPASTVDPAATEDPSVTPDPSATDVPMDPNDIPLY